MEIAQPRFGAQVRVDELLRLGGDASHLRVVAPRVVDRLRHVCRNVRQPPSFMLHLDGKGEEVDEWLEQMVVELDLVTRLFEHCRVQAKQLEEPMGVRVPVEREQILVVAVLALVDTWHLRQRRQAARCVRCCRGEIVVLGLVPRQTDVERCRELCLFGTMLDEVRERVARTRVRVGVAAKEGLARFRGPWVLAVSSDELATSGCQLANVVDDRADTDRIVMACRVEDVGTLAQNLGDREEREHVRVAEPWAAVIVGVDEKLHVRQSWQRGGADGCEARRYGAQILRDKTVNLGERLTEHRIKDGNQLVILTNRAAKVHHAIVYQDCREDGRLGPSRHR
eukprot:scaffold57086_cov59-Phaeocystis_antarctica.AAC.8